MPLGLPRLLITTVVLLAALDPQKVSEHTDVF